MLVCIAVFNRVVRWFFGLDCPECNIAAEALADLVLENENLIAVTVDCDTAPDVCTKYEFTHLPQVLLFNEDVGIYEYKQPYVYLEALEEFASRFVAVHLNI